MAYQGFGDGLYLVKQRLEGKGVKHNGILDIGNRRRDPGNWRGTPMGIHQAWPVLRVDRFEGTGAWVVLGLITDEAMAFSRMREAANNPAYDLFGNNCEHFARFVATGRRESVQLQAGLAILGLVALGFVLVKAK